MAWEKISLNEQNYVLFRHEDNVVLNEKEYLLSEDGSLRTFTYEDGIKFAESIGLSEENLEHL